MTSDFPPYHCIIIGAGPGGLQSAIHLARFNRRVLLFDHGGGRTRLAKEIVNYVGLPRVSGSLLIDTGLDQARRFGVTVRQEKVDAVVKNGSGFTVSCATGSSAAPFVIAASGANENMPGIKGMKRFFASDIYTCVTCDGQHTAGRRLVILTNSPAGARLALGMKEMYTDDITLLVLNGTFPDDLVEFLDEEGIGTVRGEAEAFYGDSGLQGILLKDGRRLSCDKAMLNLGAHLNDRYLAGLELQRDSSGAILVNDHGESSLPGLYAVGALRQGHSQAIISAGQGATAAIHINQRLLDI